MLIIITISLVTQCDSMTVTLAGMCMEESDENTEAPVPLKLFWGGVFAVVALVFTVLGGIAGVKTIKSFAGIPLTFVCLFVTFGFLALYGEASAYAKRRIRIRGWGQGCAGQRRTDGEKEQHQNPEQVRLLIPYKMQRAANGGFAVRCFF